MPKWYMPEDGHAETQVKSPGDEDIDEEVPFVMIDLGNVHDTSQPLQPYIEEKAVRVMAFADLAFNGYGVKPKVDGVTLFHATEPDSNAADIQMVWSCAEIDFAHPGKKFTFFIVTKDQGFRYLQTLLTQQGHVVHFVKDWESLQNILKLYM